MTHYRISEAAGLLGVSDDTVRRWIAGETVPAHLDDAGRQVIDGADLAAQATRIAAAPENPLAAASSARNRFVGLVTAITSDRVMSQVELQCGPHRVVSLLSTEAVRELELEIGALAVASVKATTVIIETPRANS